jgi:hypothetical protein
VSKKLNQAVTDTINELWERSIDGSMLQHEISQIIDDRGPDYDAERDWEYVAKQLGLY